jgi:outer membrane protein
MKKHFYSIIISLLICSGSFAQKIAHINFDSLISVAPEAKAVKAKAEKYMLELKTTLADMEKEFQTKYDYYLAEKANMTDLKRQITEDELQSMQKRIQDFNSQAEYEYQNKMSQLTAPLVEKARKAVEMAAKENGYKYVFDLQGNIIYSEPGDDIFSAAKKKQDAMPALTLEEKKPANTQNKGTGTQKQSSK